MRKVSVNFPRAPFTLQAFMKANQRHGQSVLTHRSAKYFLREGGYVRAWIDGEFKYTIGVTTDANGSND